ncbi:hypothetical protein [Kitasatospora sp. KL5]|uniref:hypothetical protein n=1 Tax=Kitasatospora sp. KL5 TaxID=3425125 RepID=UPI003D6FC669
MLSIGLTPTKLSPEPVVHRSNLEGDRCGPGFYVKPLPGCTSERLSDGSRLTVWGRTVPDPEEVAEAAKNKGISPIHTPYWMALRYFPDGRILEMRSYSATHYPGVEPLKEAPVSRTQLRELMLRPEFSRLDPAS